LAVRIKAGAENESLGCKTASQSVGLGVGAGIGDTAGRDPSARADGELDHDIVPASHLASTWRRRIIASVVDSAGDQL
jgi:hypothetical protein